MSGIKKQHKKYAPPSHPWQRARIEEERKLKKQYGISNKKEIWKAAFVLRRFKRSAKKLIASSSKQGDLEKKQLIEKLKKYGLANDDTKMEDILNLNVNDILNMRLQTVVFRNNMARSIGQARQFIVHGHVIVDGKKIATPSYLVMRAEQEKVTFDPSSSLSNPENPERKTAADEEKSQKKAAKKLEKKEAHDKRGRRNFRGRNREERKA